VQRGGGGAWPPQEATTKGFHKPRGATTEVYQSERCVGHDTPQFGVPNGGLSKSWRACTMWPPAPPGGGVGAWLPRVYGMVG